VNEEANQFIFKQRKNSIAYREISWSWNIEHAEGLEVYWKLKGINLAIEDMSQKISLILSPKVKLQL
jgi:hypothetical protein